MADDRDSAHEEALVALLNAVKSQAQAVNSASTATAVTARGAAAKDFAEAYAWLLSTQQAH